MGQRQSIESQHIPATSCLMRATILGFMLIAGVLSAEAAPSFDCAKASSEAEQAICKDAKLAELDAAIARAYAAALGKFKGAAAKALQEDQRSFLAIRDTSFGWPDNNLAERLQYRLTFLDEVAKAAAAAGGDFGGTWENSYGLITIKPAAGGKFAIEAQAADPVAARWVCDISDEVAPANGALTFDDADPTVPQEATATISLRREGPLLTVSEDVKPEAVRAYCGHNGAMEGAYFRTKP
jgi:uncharacterized protein